MAGKKNAGKSKSKNPYVHPDESKKMLNQVGNDGYSFDERDEDEPEVSPFDADGRVRVTWMQREDGKQATLVTGFGHVVAVASGFDESQLQDEMQSKERYYREFDEARETKHAEWMKCGVYTTDFFDKRVEYDEGVPSGFTDIRDPKACVADGVKYVALEGHGVGYAMPVENFLECYKRAEADARYYGYDLNMTDVAWQVGDAVKYGTPYKYGYGGKTMQVPMDGIVSMDTAHIGDHDYRSINPAPREKIADCWETRLIKCIDRAATWNIHGGKSYVDSSECGLNEAPKCDPEMRAFAPDTRHDLHNVEQFRDFMDSRAHQAIALSSGLRAWKNVSSEPGFWVDEGTKYELMRNFADRACMALYGVDEMVHAREWDSWQTYAGEQPYAVTGYQMIKEFESGDIQSTIDRLDTFVSNWDRVVDAEKRATREQVMSGSKPLAEVSDKSRRFWDVIESQEMLNLFVAENKGREAFTDRIHQSEHPVPIHRPGFVIRGAGVDFEALKKISEICENRHDEIGCGAKAPGYPFDGMSIVALATPPAEQPQKSARKGLDAKAAEIESQGSGFDMGAYRASMAGRYNSLSVEDAKGLSDEELSDMALAAQEQAELGD